MKRFIPSIIFCAFILLFYSTQLLAQKPNFIWNRNLGGSGSDIAGQTIQCSDGGFVTVGTSNSNDGDRLQFKGNYDIWVVKTDNVGQIVWEYSYGGPGLDEGFGITESPDNGYVVIGRIYDKGGDITKNYAKGDIWIFKISSSGGLEWNQTIGGSNIEIPSNVISTQDGGFLVSGYSASSDGLITDSKGQGDGLLIKLSSDGGISWIKTVGGAGGDRICCVVENSGSGYYAVGYTSSNDLTGINKNISGLSDIWVLKLNPIGDIDWQKVYGGSNADAGYNLIRNSKGNLVVCGTTYSNDYDFTQNLGKQDYCVLSINSNGNLIWAKNYGGSKDDVAEELLEINNGYIVIGTTQSYEPDIVNHHTGLNGNSDIWLISIDTSGKLLNNLAIGGDGDESIASIILLPDSSYVIAGSSDFVSGDIIQNNGSRDYWIFKGAKYLNIEQSDFVQSNNITVYPSPAYSKVFLKNIPMNATIRLTNTDGRIMYNKTDFRFNYIDVSNYPTGIYIIMVIDENNKTLYRNKIVII